MTSAGDVNNDEYDDFLIGACQNNEGGNEAGQIYLIFGRRAGSFSMNTDLSDADASFIGENEEDYAGYSVASAGDVNNDGYDDIFIGAYSRSGGFAGKAYLIFGNEVGSFSMHTNLSDADASFIGEGTGDVAGNSVASAGDVNNDGYDDILIGAYKNDEGGDWAGKIYLFFGNEADFFSMNTDLSDANASFIGEETCDFAGISVASAGDVNNDEYDDILIGACGYEKGPGKVYFIFGNEAGSFSMDTDLSNANASFIGERTYDYAGISVACAGDVNNDGYDDILIGAYGNNEGGADAGQTYLVFGGFKEEKEEDKIPGYTTLLLVIFSFSTMIFLLLKSLKKVKN
ncbi:MAG: FG-GAP repeat protein [Candidatus Lokiarchaeota archaeon]|nr:FG-GAP repeat protein [Candidatus Lokiarchaeota archaeon]